MTGITHHVRTAPPVSMTSVIFMAASIAIIEIRDMPIAVLKAILSDICLARIMVSRAIDVINPLKTARPIMAHTGQTTPIN
jgi:hypothetical protein